VIRTAASVAAILLGMACHSAPTPQHPIAPTVLTVLPAESDTFPAAAAAITESLTHASVTGVDRKQLSKVSLEVVQLSIECVEATTVCYEAVGKSLSANRLLFGHVSRGDKKNQVTVTVTLFDVDAKAPKTAEKTFATEKEATDGVADLVAEATR
jgi:hypothetical protein